MKLKDLIKELELYDKELQVIVQNKPFIMVDIGSFDRKTAVHIFSVDESELKSHIQYSVKDCNSYFIEKLISRQI